MSLQFPNFNPVALELGPLKIRWYGLSYVVGILSGWKLGIYLNKKHPNGMTTRLIDDSLMWIVLGLVIGARIGFVVFYDPMMIVHDPLEIFMTWHGGMAFHGGLIGVLLAVFLFCRKHKLTYFTVGDLYATISPIGLFFGRIANFVNGEIWGRTTDVPWGVVFPGAGDLPRHPSQLYEAALEGLVLQILMIYCWTTTDMRHKKGRLAGVFMLGYGVARIICECFREPDAIVFGSISIGQALSLPLIGLGWFFLRRPVEKNDPSSYPSPA